MPDVTRQQIVDGIRALGVQPGDCLLVHSLLSSFGHVTGGAVAVAEALVDSVGPGGDAFVPTFTYGQSPFSPTTTPSMDGAITEAFRTLPDAKRSAHPTHSLAGIGPNVPEVLVRHEMTTPFGLASPLWRLWERNAWVLLIGCDQTANSMVHVAEERERMAYLDRRRRAQVHAPDGTIQEVEVRRPGCSAAFQVIDPALRARNAIREGKVGLATLSLMRSRDIVDVLITMLRGNPEVLLCGRAECTACAQALAMLRAD